MALSSKAREIRDHIVNSKAVDYWLDQAKQSVKTKPQYQPGKPYSRDVPSLVAKLKTELSCAFADATDSHWEQIADWLFDQVRPG